MIADCGKDRYRFWHWQTLSYFFRRLALDDEVQSETSAETASSIEM